MSDPSDPTGSDAIEHDYKGSISLNLINAGQPDIRVASEDEPSFNITVTDVSYILISRSLRVYSYDNLYCMHACRLLFLQPQQPTGARVLDSKMSG